VRSVKNIVQHELIGLECEVIDAMNKSQIGIKGRVTDETLKTLVINSKRIFKRGSRFCFRLNNENINVDGNQLIARPEDRIKKKIKKW